MRLERLLRASRPLPEGGDKLLGKMIDRMAEHLFAAIRQGQAMKKYTSKVLGVAPDDFQELLMILSAISIQRQRLFKFQDKLDQL